MFSYMCFQVDCGNTEKLILPKILKLFYIQAAFNDIFPESVFFHLQPVIFVKVSYNYTYIFYLYVEIVLLFGFYSRIMELV